MFWKYLYFHFCDKNSFQIDFSVEEDWTFLLKINGQTQIQIIKESIVQMYSCKII